MESIPIRRKFVGKKYKVPTWVKESTFDLLRRSHIKDGVKSVVKAIAHDKETPLHLQSIFNHKLSRVQSQKALLLTASYCKSSFIRSAQSLRKLPQITSPLFLTKENVVDEAVIKEEPTQLVRVMENDKQAQQYLEKMNYQRRDDIKPLESLDLITSNHFGQKKMKTILKQTHHRSRVMTLVRNASGLTVAFRGNHQFKSPNNS